MSDTRNAVQPWRSFESQLVAVRRWRSMWHPFRSPTLQLPNKVFAARDLTLETEFQNITSEQVGESDEDTFESRHYLPSWLVEKIQRDKLRGQKV